jgi:hypothetical protein
MKITVEQGEKIRKSLAKMKILNRLMDFEYNMEMPDVAKSSLVRNHVAKLKTSIEQIEINLNHVIRTKESDVLDEFCGELLDSLTILSMMSLESLQSFNNDLKEFLKEQEEVVEEIPDFQGTMDGLNDLTIRKNKDEA